MRLLEIVAQLESCKYECEAGPLEMNTAFIALKEAARPDPAGVRKIVAEMEPYLKQWDGEDRCRIPYDTVKGWTQKLRSILAPSQQGET